MPRVESAAAIFDGELRTVFDLLFQTQHDINEDVLEAILANLSSCLVALNRMLMCMPEDRPPSRNLDKNLSHIRTKATQICSTCVPNAFAKDLGEWMDKVQVTALQIPIPENYTPTIPPAQ